MVGGAAVFERQAYFIERQLDQLQLSAFPDKSEREEFHASAMRGRKGMPWKPMAKGVVQSLMTDVYKVIDTAHDPGLCLFAVAVDKTFLVPDFPRAMSEALRAKKEAESALQSESGPADMKRQRRESLSEAKREIHRLTSAIICTAFERVCTQFEFFLRRFYADRPENEQRGVMILDHASYERDLGALIESFRKIGTGATKIHNIIDAPFFASSSSTRLLQVADFVSYAVYRRYEAADTRYFDLIAHRFDKDAGICHGLAHLSAASNCMCPACLTRRIGRAALRESTAKGSSGHPEESGVRPDS